jgi:hypothetical protein
MKRLTILLVLFIFGIGFAQSENFETRYIDILKKDIQTEAKKRKTFKPRQKCLWVKILK